MPSTGVNGHAAAAPSNEDLLRDIFGSSSSTTAASTASSQPPRSTVQDILGLFDSSPTPVAVAAAASPPLQQAASSNAGLFDAIQAASPPPQPQLPTQPRLVAYPAYDKNELRVTLTPQASPTRPGVVDILVRFQVTGGNAATGVNFQAAVPKVLYSSSNVMS